MKTKFALLANVAAVSIAAFDNNNGWKTDESGNLVKDGDGNPVYINSEGAEQSVRGDTISRLNGEAKSHRERAETAEATLKEFEGLDAKQAREAIEKVKKIGDKELIDAGKVDEVRSEMKSTYEGQIQERDKELESLRGKVDAMTLDTKFNGSEFVRDNIAVPQDMFEATFRNRFKVENGDVVPLDTNGQPLYSKKNLGEVASFDEALELMVEGHKHKDTILKAPEHRGSGGAGGGERGTGRVIRRADFDAMDEGKRGQVAAQQAKGEVQIVD